MMGYFENALAAVFIIAVVFFLVWQSMMSIDEMMALRGF